MLISAWCQLVGTDGSAERPYDERPYDERQYNECQYDKFKYNIR